MLGLPYLATPAFRVTGRRGEVKPVCCGCSRPLMCPQAAIPGCPLSRRYLGVKQTLSKPTGLTVLDCCEDAVGRLLNALSCHSGLPWRVKSPAKKTGRIPALCFFPGTPSPRSARQTFGKESTSDQLPRLRQAPGRRRISDRPPRPSQAVSGSAIVSTGWQWLVAIAIISEEFRASPRISLPPKPRCPCGGPNAYGDRWSSVRPGGSQWRA
jgi:hypothetical protein